MSGKSNGEQVIAQFLIEFTEVRSISVEDLMYVKEDLIIPHVRFFVYFNLILIESNSFY